MSAITVVSIVAALALGIAYLARMQRMSLRWPGDAELLAEMRREGIDLSMPHTIEFHLHFPSRVVALEAERAIVTEGFEAQVSAGEGLPAAILCAKRALVPNASALKAVRAQLVAFSRRYGGSYEGWIPPRRAGGGA